MRKQLQKDTSLRSYKETPAANLSLTALKSKDIHSDIENICFFILRGVQFFFLTGHAS